MVEIYPFKAMRFENDDTDSISKSVSPPYDIISPELKQYLKKINNNNIVNLILPDEENDLNRYESAKKKLNDWIKSNILTFDDKECFYIFEESFMENGKWKSFNAFIGLNKIEEYESKKVLRHEYTLSKPKEDRLNLIREAKTNFGLIYTLYDDKEKKIQDILDECMTCSKPLYDFIPDYDTNLKFKIWKIDDDAKINSIIKLMEERNILIADGHHRYETSRIFMHEVKSLREQNIIKPKKTMIDSINREIFPEDVVLTLFVNFNQKNIKILPTHRMIRFKNFTNFNDISKRLEKYFNINNYSDAFGKKPSEELRSDNTGKINLLKNIKTSMDSSKKRNICSFCFMFANNSIIFADLNKKISDIYGDLKKDDEVFENLDVRILHRLIIEDLLSDLIIDRIDYTHSLDELANKIHPNENYDLGIILNAPDISVVEFLSSVGKIMPQKSTYFYPKPCSGLLMYKMDL